MDNCELVITGWGSLSSLGSSIEETRESYQRQRTRRSFVDSAPVYRISEMGDQEISKIAESNPYKDLDRVVHMAIACSRKAVDMAGIRKDYLRTRGGVSIGSARGATISLEGYHKKFLERGKEKLSPLASPTTTAGNISSWSAYDLGITGIDIDVSMTCISAMHSILNGVAWLRSGMADVFIAGGAEASLTEFTVAQMKALRLYADLEREKDGLILGEGGACFVIERGDVEREGRSVSAKIKGIGYSRELSRSGTSISGNGSFLADSMATAIGQVPLDQIGAVILHAPGTQKGNSAEMEAIDTVFSNYKPHLLSNKHLTGHTFGASGALNIELALLIFGGLWQDKLGICRYILINSAGFGGGCVSVLLESG